MQDRSTGISVRIAMVALGACVALSCLLVTGGSAHNRSTSPGAVDDARLSAAGTDARNWIVPGGSYAGRHYSALTQIDRKSVASLAPAWTFHTGLHGGFEATPLVIDGVMYLTTPFDDVVALDARRGTQLWRYHHQLTSKPCCGPANRGAAAGYGRIYLATVDARLIALDQHTGAVLWDVPLAAGAGGNVEQTGDLTRGDKLRNQRVIGQTGVFANMAPLVYRGKVVVGITGVGYGLHLGSTAGGDQLTEGVVGIAGDYGHRGFYAAFDAKTGREVWRWYTIPPNGWEGTFTDTTPDGAPLQRDVAAERADATRYAGAWKTGGGSAWTTPAYDQKLGLLYAGVGNPSPQFQDQTRPGDNLYSVSLVALDAETGELRWSFQQVPHDLWGYDVASPPVLFDTVVDGKVVPALGQAGKTGWYYVLDRRNGAFIRKSEPFVPQENLFAAPTAAGIRIAPGAFGGASWSPAAYDPSTGLAYVAAINIPMRYQVRSKADPGVKPEAVGVGPGDSVAATDSVHTSAADALYTEATPSDDVPHSGTLTAIETSTGHIRWQRKMAQPLVGGTLATAGGLVFMGEGDGDFDAFDAACGAGVNAPPIAYEVDGREYVAVAAGGNALFGYTSGDALTVFALPAK
jgi:PQQ-dependent dehydrogenase (methanol/ethanol family)